MNRNKKTPMFVSTINSNYDFVDYTNGDGQSQPQQGSALGTAQGIEKPKGKSIFDQMVEAKEQEVDLPPPNTQQQEQKPPSGGYGYEAQPKQNTGMQLNFTSESSYSASQSNNSYIQPRPV